MLPLNTDLSKLEEETCTKKDLDFVFNCKDVRDGIKILKRNKQPGIDLIYNEFLILG